MNSKWPSSDAQVPGTDEPSLEELGARLRDELRLQPTGTDPSPLPAKPESEPPKEPLRLSWRPLVSSIPPPPNLPRVSGVKLIAGTVPRSIPGPDADGSGRASASGLLRQVRLDPPAWAALIGALCAVLALLVAPQLAPRGLTGDDAGRAASAEATQAATAGRLSARVVATLCRSGEALLRAGQARSAERVFREALVRAPDDTRALRGLARALHALGRPTEAVTPRLSVHADQPGRAPAPTQ